MSGDDDFIVVELAVQGHREDAIIFHQHYVEGRCRYEIIVRLPDTLDRARMTSTLFDTTPETPIYLHGARIGPRGCPTRLLEERGGSIVVEVVPERAREMGEPGASPRRG